MADNATTKFVLRRYGWVQEMTFTDHGMVAFSLRPGPTKKFPWDQRAWDNLMDKLDQTRVAHWPSIVATVEANLGLPAGHMANVEP